MSEPGSSVKVLTGSEPFHDGGQPLPFSILNFWSWAYSDLLSNALRGVLAEFLVAKALGIDCPPRVEWDACDLCTPSGMRIEVKTSSYVQSWKQTRLSQPSFDIAPKRAWYADTNTSAPAPIRTADVYVFAMHAHRDRASADPTDLSQWEFYVVPTAILNERCPGQKRVGLARVRQFSEGPLTYPRLRQAIERSEAARANQTMRVTASDQARD